MRYILALLMTASVAFGGPLPATMNSQSRVAPSLQTYQATKTTWRITYKDGVSSVNLTNLTPFMSWATSNTAASFVTSSWSTVGDVSTGVVDFTFTSGNLNTNGNFIYEVGIVEDPFIQRQGSFQILSSVYPSGTNITFATSINWGDYVYTGTGPWLDDVSNVISVVNGGTSGTTGEVSRSGSEVTVTFPAVGAVPNLGSVLIAGSSASNNSITDINNVTGGTGTFYHLHMTGWDDDMSHGDDEAVTEGRLDEELTKLAVQVLYGATNAHSVIAGAGSLWRELPTAWTNTYDMGSTGLFHMGSYYLTNAIVDGANAGTYEGFTKVKKSAVNGSVRLYMDLIESDGTTTNTMVDKSVYGASDAIPTDLSSVTIPARLTTNYAVAAADRYLGVDIYYEITTAHPTPNLLVYGGTNYGTKLTTPSLTYSSGGGVSQATLTAATNELIRETQSYSGNHIFRPGGIRMWSSGDEELLAMIITNGNSGTRTYTFQDKSGTVAHTDDIPVMATAAVFDPLYLQSITVTGSCGPDVTGTYTDNGTPFQGAAVYEHNDGTYFLFRSGDMLTVTGALSPDYAGTFFKHGAEDWQRTDGGAYVWLQEAGPAWILSEAYEVAGSDYFSKTGVVFGAYSAVGSATGDPIGEDGGSDYAWISSGTNVYDPAFYSTSTNFGTFAAYATATGAPVSAYTGSVDVTAYDWLNVATGSGVTNRYLCAWQPPIDALPSASIPTTPTLTNGAGQLVDVWAFDPDIDQDVGPKPVYLKPGDGTTFVFNVVAHLAGSSVKTGQVDVIVDGSRYTSEDIAWGADVDNPTSYEVVIHATNAFTPPCSVLLGWGHSATSGVPTERDVAIYGWVVEAGVIVE